MGVTLIGFGRVSYRKTRPVALQEVVQNILCGQNDFHLYIIDINARTPKKLRFYTAKSLSK